MKTFDKYKSLAALGNLSTVAGHSPSEQLKLPSKMANHLQQIYNDAYAEGFIKGMEAPTIKITKTS